MSATKNKPSLLQLWTQEQLPQYNTECEKCQTLMVPGYAIEPGHRDYGCRIGPEPPSLRYEDIDIIMVLKCPKCGNSEEIPQDAFKDLPPGFASWNAYWKSDIREQK